ncbi:MAG: hypothetical protein ACK56F_05350 [bacterium]
MSDWGHACLETPPDGPPLASARSLRDSRSIAAGGVSGGSFVNPSALRQ